MTLKEFAALKAGDRIANYMANSVGEVTAVDDKGVHVRWGRIWNETQDGGTRFYPVTSTIWMHWSLETEIASAQV